MQKDGRKTFNKSNPILLYGSANVSSLTMRMQHLVKVVFTSAISILKSGTRLVARCVIWLHHGDVCGLYSWEYGH